MAKILSIAPYKFLPPKNGGHWGVYLVEDTLSLHNDVFTLSVNTNEPYNTAFEQINILKDTKWRYIPFKLTKVILRTARQTKATHIFCHHHYMFPAAYNAAKQLKIPIYIRSHNIEYERFKTMKKPWWRLMFLFEKWAYNKADRIFFLSHIDIQTAIHTMGLPPEKASLFPFSSKIPRLQTPTKTKKEVAESLNLNHTLPWLIFMGDLRYAPNANAVDNILTKILPILQQHTTAFEIIICGKGLESDIAQRIQSTANINYLGFVDDLNTLLYHSRMMLNPVLSGGGVKTKVIESLSWNLDIVSCHTGALGLDIEFCGEKLNIIPDNDWEQFANTIMHLLHKDKTDIASRFFDHYYSGNIANSIQTYFNV